MKLIRIFVTMVILKMITGIVMILIIMVVHIVQLVLVAMTIMRIVIACLSCTNYWWLLTLLSQYIMMVINYHAPTVMNRQIMVFIHIHGNHENIDIPGWDVLGLVEHTSKVQCHQPVRRFWQGPQSPMSSEPSIMLIQMTTMTTRERPSSSVDAMLPI